MAKFVTEDGKDGISGDRLYDMIANDPTYSGCGNSCMRKRHAEVSKLKIPNGDKNYKRLTNMCNYDLLTHIQETLSMSNRCILELITNEDHQCINNNDTILNRIHQFAESNMNDEFILTHPRSKVRYKSDEDEDGKPIFSTRDETDEEWHDRLCHLYMHAHHPHKLQMIKCEECIQHWLNSSKW